MSLQATRQKHCDRAHPYQRNLKDGISLFGRETPAYILEEVGRRQAADRGTSSIWAKLAADYGPKHANFIVKHDTKFPIPRNDRNSWSNIAQAYVDKKRARPASAPNVKLERREIQRSKNVDVIPARNRLSSARARLADISTQKDGPMTMFRRTEELQVVVNVLQHTAVGRLHRKLKKGERKKAAAAAAAAATDAARRGSSGSDSIRYSSVEGRPSSTILCPGEGSSHRPLSVVSSRGSDVSGHKYIETLEGSKTGQRRQWRRPKTARQHHRAPARLTVTSARRHRGSKTRPATAPAIACTSSKRRRSADSGAQRRVSSLAGTHNGVADADGKLGMARARTRIYSFGAGGGSDGNSTHREDVFRATAIDAARRRHNLNRDHSTAGHDPLYKTVAGVAVGGVMLYGREETVRSIDLGKDDDDENDDACSSSQFGVVDISKLTTVLSHAEVSGHVHATNATEPTPEPGDGNPNGIAPASSLKGRGKGARASESCEVPPTVSETSGSSRSGTGTSESDGGDDDSDAEQEEEGTSPEGGDGVGGKEMPGGNIWEGQLATRRSPERGGESFTPGVGNSRLDCLRGRYARAEATSRSARAKKRGVTAFAADGTAPLTPNAAHASSAASATATRNSKGLSCEIECTKSPLERGMERGRGRGRAKAKAMAWRDKLAAVQRRRAMLEDSMRSEANRLVEARAKRQASASCNASVSVSVSVQRAGCILDSKACSDDDARPLLKRKVKAAMMIQRAFRATRQRELWLGNQCDQDYVSQVNPEKVDGERERQETLQDDPPRSQHSLVTGSSSSRLGASQSYRTLKLHHRHVAVRTKRMIRGFISCTQARFLLLQLLWDKTEGVILGERRSKRAAVESRAAATIQQLSHIRRIAVGLIKMQNSAQSFKLDHQSRPAKKSTKATPGGSRHKQGGRNQGGGGRAFETAKEARSEKAECEAILREHGRRGRRLVDVAVRDRFLRDLLYSFRRQHITRDHSEYLLETSRPPFVDSRDVKRMLACPAEEMHLFSDPKNYRTRLRYTRLALPLREIEGRIQDTIASHVRSEYRDKLKEALGTVDGTASVVDRGDPEGGAANSGNFAHVAPKLAARAAVSALIDKHSNIGGTDGTPRPAGNNTVADQSQGQQQQQQRPQQGQTQRAEHGITVNPNGRSKRRASVVFARGGVTTSTSQVSLSPRQYAPEPARSTAIELAGHAPAATVTGGTAGEGRAWQSRQGGIAMVVPVSTTNSAAA